MHKTVVNILLLSCLFIGIGVWVLWVYPWLQPQGIDQFVVEYEGLPAKTALMDLETGSVLGTLEIQSLATVKEMIIVADLPPAQPGFEYMVIAYRKGEYHHLGNMVLANGQQYFFQSRLLTNDIWERIEIELDNVSDTAPSLIVAATRSSE